LQLIKLFIPKQKSSPFLGRTSKCYLTYTTGLPAVAVEASDGSETVVLVEPSGQVISIRDVAVIEDVWVSNYAVTGLECNTGLESIGINCTYHL
jgi:hypothetical protein